MERIITLLREKNHYLEKFHEINERELAKFEHGNFDGVENFYGTREKILELIRCIDELIHDENDSCSNDPRCSALEKSEVEVLLKTKEAWVGKILAQDLEVLSSVEKEKSSIIRELQSIRKGRKAVQGYQSGEPRNLLDEKA